MHLWRTKVSGARWHREDREQRLKTLKRKREKNPKRIRKVTKKGEGGHAGLFRVSVFEEREREREEKKKRALKRDTMAARWIGKSRYAIQCIIHGVHVYITRRIVNGYHYKPPGSFLFIHKRAFKWPEEGGGGGVMEAVLRWNLRTCSIVSANNLRVFRGCFLRARARSTWCVCRTVRARLGTNDDTSVLYTSVN